MLLLRDVFQPYAWLYRDFLGITKRQSEVIIAGPQCYELCNQANYVFQSIGFTSQLCATDGSFATAMAYVYSCIRQDTTDTTSMQIDDLNGALNFCNGLNINLGTISNIITATTRSDTLNALVVSLCSEARAGQTTLTLISCLPTTSSNGTLASMTPTPTLTPTLSTSTIAPADTSAAITESPVTTSTEVIAGIAVGAALGGMLVLGFILFFIRRHRRRRQSKTSTEPSEEAQGPEEKAQLHSDEYVPPRWELHGTRAPPQVRVVGGLEEMEFDPSIARDRAEFAANDPVGAELNGGKSRSEPIGEASTLVASSASTEDHPSADRRNAPLIKRKPLNRPMSKT